MSGFYTQLTEHVAAFAVVYGIFLSFGEAGPGDCLGLLASKTWPTAARGQMCEFFHYNHLMLHLVLAPRPVNFVPWYRLRANLRGVSVLCEEALLLRF